MSVSVALTLVAILGSKMKSTLVPAALITTAPTSVKSAVPVKLENGFRRIATRAQMTLTTGALRDLLYRIEASKPFLFIDNLDVRLGRKSRRRRDAEQDEEIQLLVRMDVFGFLAAPPPQTAGQAS